MPRRKTAVVVVALAVLLLACVGVFLAQPGILTQLQRPSAEKKLGHSGKAATPPPLPTPAPTPAPTPQPTPAPFGYEYPLVVEKNAVSSRMRIVFLVGLEGTGHHYFADVLENMCKKSSVRCPNVCKVAKALWPSLSLPKSRGEYETARRHLRQEMEALATYAREALPDGNATMASFGSCRWEAGMMSYPNFGGPEKSLMYVDFRVLAEEAERAGLDLRFVYLTRSASSILISDTEHNNYGGSFIRESRVLLNNAAVVQSTFRELGPGFTTCFRYEDMPDPAQATRVSHFLAPTEYLAQRLQGEMLARVKMKSPPPPGSPGFATRDQEQGHGGGGVAGSRLPGFNESQSVRAEGSDGPETAARAAARAAVSGNNTGRGIIPSGDLPKDLLVARLQQKLDQIERELCFRTNDASTTAP